SRTLEALALYVEAKSPDDVARLIDAEGLALYDAGHVAELERALAVVDAERRAHDPLVLAVEGLIRGFRDDAEGAHASLGAARAQATNDPELAAELAYRHAYVAYHSSGFKAALAVMGPKSADRISDPARRARTLGARAFFVALDERLPEADELATKALRAIERCGESVDKALVLRLAATVAFHCGRSEEARTLALEAVRLAEKLGLPGLTARFATELYLIAYRLGDVALAKWTLALVAREAERAADHPALRFALVNGYEFSVEQGDERRLEELEREIRANPRRVSSDEVLASAVAFQLAWNRDFSQAATTVEALSASIQQPARLGFLRGFEFVFWTAGGRRAEAEAALASASAALEKVGPERYGRDRLVYTKARAWLAVGLLSLGRNQSALREIRELEGQRQTHPGIKALVVALRALHLHAETGAADSEVRSAFAKLSRAGYGGYARLLEALPIRSTPAVAPVFGALTPAEIEVLRGIAEGATSRSLAQQLGRSHFTIDSHVKAIVRKLGCPGRREAIQMARAHGLA
ncbi:MAG: LuxR C-terminal-related transcriptional regulator, partial [Vulcanimicrobiaceae bacterium]